MSATGITALATKSSTRPICSRRLPIIISQLVLPACLSSGMTSRSASTAPPAPFTIWAQRSVILAGRGRCSTLPREPARLALGRCLSSTISSFARPVRLRPQNFSTPKRESAISAKLQSTSMQLAALAS